MAAPETKDPQNSNPASGNTLDYLHPMSRTAGVGTQEYVAVNATAVVTLLLGAISAAAVASDVLLVLPVATVIVGIVALMQVRRSGGTQTGAGLAAVGLILALIFVGWIGGRAWSAHRAVEDARGQVVSLIDKLSKAVTSNSYEPAWECFGDTFRAEVRKKAFFDTWTRLQGIPGYGPLKGIRWNTRLEVQIDPNTGVKFANGVLLIDTASGAPDRWAAAFRWYPDRGWLIENIDTGEFPRTPLDTGPTPLLPN